MVENKKLTKEPIVKIENVAFAYDGQLVLDDVNLQIKPQDFVCVVGPNGGGKTTLLKLMLGLLEPQRGAVRVLGERPEKVCRQVGYVPQHSHVDPQFPASVLDVVLMGRLGRTRRFGPFRKKDRTWAKDALRLMGLEKLPTRGFSTLSGGQRQRVLIARALAGEPELLLLDEPTSNLDVAAETELHEYLDNLSRDITVVIVSHDIGFVTRYVRTVVCVNRTVQTHHTHEITGEFIRQVYGSEMQMVCHDHYKKGEDCR